MPLQPFSKRHSKAIFAKKIQPSLIKRLRKRIWYILDKYNYSIWVQRDQGQNWTDQTDLLSEIKYKLKMLYGVDELEAFNDKNKKVNVDLDNFVIGCYPTQVFDVVEVFYEELTPDKQPLFQKDINQCLLDEGCPWMLCDGYFFQMDSRFIEEQVLSRTNELLKSNQFEGALQEFNEARNDFATKDYKSAIHNSCKAFESVLKTIQNRSDGNAKTLIDSLKNIDFYKDLPDELSKGFGDNVLMSLPFIRNRVGGHGQGSEIIDVSRDIAELTINLSGCFIYFIINRYIEMSGKPKTEDSSTLESSDDVPF